MTPLLVLHRSGEPNEHGYDYVDIGTLNTPTLADIGEYSLTMNVYQNLED